MYLNVATLQLGHSVYYMHYIVTRTAIHTTSVQFKKYFNYLSTLPCTDNYIRFCITVITIIIVLFQCTHNTEINQYQLNKNKKSILDCRLLFKRYFIK